MTTSFAERKGARRLSAEERELWRNVTLSVKPIRPSRVLPPEADPAPEAKAAKIAAPLPAPGEAARRSKPSVPSVPPLAPLGRRLKGRVARGSEPIDGRLDLHGLTQAEAYDALLGFLTHAQGRSAKLVLVITGKGSRGSGAGYREGERGVLRQLVPRWLAMPEFRATVVAFETAHTGHGGEGALYVRLRRARSGTKPQ